MKPTVFTDSRLPDVEILWWPSYGLFENWLKIGRRRVFRSSHYREALSMAEADKVAKELFSAVLDRVCDGVAQDLGTYVSERKE